MTRPIRIAFALPGLHRVVRGAEVALESVAERLANRPEFDLPPFGSGPARDDQPYRYSRVDCVARETFTRLPSMPVFRNDCAWEEATFAAALHNTYNPEHFDATLTCGYPFCNWLLSRAGRRDSRPAHVFVCQNGDWPAHNDQSEFRFFRCDRLVCLTGEQADRNRDRWHTTVIPNGVDPVAFTPGPAERAALGVPADVPLVLTVAALIESKRVDRAIEAVAQLPDAHHLVIGDGPQRDRIDALGRDLLGQRYTRITLPREHMRNAYRAADTLLHASMDEPFGIIYLEALACGLPVVAHDRPDTRDILGSFGFPVDTQNLNATAETLRRALTHTQDPAAANAYVDAHYSWDTVADRYADLLHSMKAAQ